MRDASRHCVADDFETEAMSRLLGVTASILGRRSLGLTGRDRREHWDYSRAYREATPHVSSRQVSGSNNRPRVQRYRRRARAYFVES